ncbi:hypothetical protein LTR37_009209 [Vermiconidia calcicola]|uniref:Uncharacterized protein n=1 Tax=Vermiconidia calcicola TaxID=1690605 RepID=A0ACC3NA61_9PEZI|nr:hypothetical protein LTR37_009209 [Vermiconidia calcicola]
MTGDAAKEASDILIKHWQDGTTLDALPEAIRPSNFASGYEIQRHVERLTSKPLFGWKIAATSTAGQHHINVSRPLAGRILQERVTPLGGPVSLGPNRMQVAELEFVFRMGRTLEPRAMPYEVREVMDAVDGLFLGVEVPDSRFTDFTKVGAAQLIADNAAADRFVLGPEVTSDWRSTDLTKHVVKGWTGDGTGEKDTVRSGSGAAVLGDPRLAMTWLANELSDHGVPLAEGQYVTTGTCIIPIPVKPGTRVTGDYGEFGMLQVEFVE